MAEGKLYGVDIDWMQAQWRDCADKGAQLEIFRDMTGRKATIQQILDAVGDPAYCGPTVKVKRKYERYTEADEETIIRMAAEGATNKTIGDALGKSEDSISMKITSMRKKGIEVRRQWSSAEKPVESEARKPAGKGSFSKIEAELIRLLEREEDLLERLAAVRSEIEAYRKKLGDLIELAGGGLDRAEP